MRFIIVFILGLSAICQAQIPKIKGFRKILAEEVQVPKRMSIYSWDSLGEAKLAVVDTGSSKNELIPIQVKRSFAIGETEVTNKEWWEFVFAVVDEKMKGNSSGNQISDLAFLLNLDTGSKFENLVQVWMYNRGRNNIVYDGVPVLPSFNCWLEDFPEGYAKPMAEYYFSHPAYMDFPVVGISHDQAMAYCKWKSKQLNSDQWMFSLPTEDQFIAASMSIPQNKKKLKGYAPYLPFTRNSKGMILLNYNPSNDLKVPDNHLASDGHMYTAPSVSYFPNQNGLYNLHGNVAEWTRTKGTNSNEFLVKGGSYIDPLPCIWPKSYTSLHHAKGDSRVGFRMVLVEKE